MRRWRAMLAVFWLVGAGPTAATAASMASVVPHGNCGPGTATTACRCRKIGGAEGQVCLRGEACNVHTGVCRPPPPPASTGKP